MLFLCLCHFTFKFPKLDIGYRFQAAFGFVGTFLTFGMLTVVCVPNQLFALTPIAPALPDPFLTGNGIALVDDLFAKLGIGRKGRVVFLNSGV